MSEKQTWPQKDNSNSNSGKKGPSNAKMTSLAKPMSTLAAGPMPESKGEEQEWSLDAWVQLSTSLPSASDAIQSDATSGGKEESAVIGQILSYLPKEALLILRCPQVRGGHAGAHVSQLTWHIKMFNTHAIINVTFFKTFPSHLFDHPTLQSDASSIPPYAMRPLDIQKLQQKEQKAVFLERKKMAQTGVGVTPAAQSLFDQLIKTYRYLI